MCPTRSSRCTLASTIVRRTSGNTFKNATNICDWRPRPASGASGPLAKAKRKCHPIVELFDAVQWEDVQKFLPEGCRMGIDRLDRSWRLSAWGHRTTLGTRLCGVKGFAQLTDPICLGESFGARVRHAVPVWFYRTTDERAKAHHSLIQKSVNQCRTTPGSERTDTR